MLQLQSRFTTLDGLKKECEAKNAEIKTIMGNNDLHSFVTDKYNASYIIKESTKVNEEKLLALLQEQGDTFRSLGIIKTREYVDDEALEAAIYNGQIDKELLVKIKDCSTIVKTPTLTVKRRKE